jgi:hypothetical protein
MPQHSLPDCGTTAARVLQRRRYAAVPPKGVRLRHRFLCAEADRCTTAATRCVVGELKKTANG